MRRPYRLPSFLEHPVLYGDWHPLVRDPIDLIRLTYVAGALVAIALGDVSGGARLGATALFVYIARLVNVPRPFDLGFTLSMGLQGWGNAFDLFDSIGWWDTLVHFSLSLWTAPLFYIGLARLGIVPDLSRTRERHRVGVFVVTLSLGLAFGACYEVYEWVVDHWFGGSLEIGESDTVGDLAMDAVGSALGGALLVVWSRYGWQTIRRIPGQTIEDPGTSGHGEPRPAATAVRASGGGAQQAAGENGGENAAKPDRPQREAEGRDRARAESLAE